MRRPRAAFIALWVFLPTLLLALGDVTYHTAPLPVVRAAAAAQLLALGAAGVVVAAFRPWAGVRAWSAARLMGFWGAVYVLYWVLGYHQSVGELLERASMHRAASILEWGRTLLRVIGMRYLVLATGWRWFGGRHPRTWGWGEAAALATGWAVLGLVLQSGLRWTVARLLGDPAQWMVTYFLEPACWLTLFGAAPLALAAWGLSAITRLPERLRRARSTLHA